MFAICIESSHARGMGHFYRALNFSEILMNSDIPFKFFLNKNNVAINILKLQNISYEIVDLYDMQSNWERKIILKNNIQLWLNDRLDTDERHAKHIVKLNIPLVTFDDRGSGAAYSDVHIAAMAFDNKEKLRGKKIFRGIDYLILNSEISYYMRLRTEVKKILVTMGGSDTYGITVEVIKELAKRNQAATVILGPSFTHYQELTKVVNHKITLKKSVPSLAQEFEQYDLAITGGGITPFEAAASGLPCIIIANELFEVPIGKALADLGCALFAGHYTHFDKSVFAKTLHIEKMSASGMKNISLMGRNKVLEKLLGLIE